MIYEFHAKVISAGNRVFVPTLGVVPNGPILCIMPVASVSLEDREGLKALIMKRVAQGNPVASPDEENALTEAKKLIGARSWKQFDQKTRSWRLKHNAQGWTLSPTTLHKTGFVVDDIERTQRLPDTKTVDEVAEAFVNMVMSQVHGDLNNGDRPLIANSNRA